MSFQNNEENKKAEETLAEIPQSHIYSKSAKKPSLKIQCGQIAFYLIIITMGLCIFALSLRESNRGDKIKMYFFLIVSLLILTTASLCCLRYIIQFISPNFRIFKLLQEEPIPQP